MNIRSLVANVQPCSERRSSGTLGEEKGDGVAIYDACKVDFVRRLKLTLQLVLEGKVAP